MTLSEQPNVLKPTYGAAFPQPSDAQTAWPDAGPPVKTKPSQVTPHEPAGLGGGGDGGGGGGSCSTGSSAQHSTRRVAPVGRQPNSSGGSLSVTSVAFWPAHDAVVDVHHTPVVPDAPHSPRRSPAISSSRVHSRAPSSSHIAAASAWLTTGKPHPVAETVEGRPEQTFSAAVPAA